jgi:hypothetical protein
VAVGSPGTTGNPEGVTGSSQQSQSHHELTTAVSGFPKSKNGQYSIESILKGQIGDDAYFITRHVDDWNNNDSNEDSKECANKLLNPSNISGRVFSVKIVNPMIVTFSSIFHVLFTCCRSDRSDRSVIDRLCDICQEKVPPSLRDKTLATMYNVIFVIFSFSPRPWGTFLDK